MSTQTGSARTMSPTPTDIGADTAPTDDTGTLPGSRGKAARLHHIRESVRQLGFVTVDALAAELRVSRMTIHRDLDELQNDRVLRKVRGGASAERTTNFESDFEYRANEMLAEKRAIARAAAVFANDGDVVVIGDSSTTSHVVPHLLKLENVTVVSNFLPVIDMVGQAHGASLIALGGQYHARYRSFLGLLCEQALKNLHADVLFASSSALMGTEVFHQDELIVKVKQVMLRSSRTRVLMLDNTKLGHGALHRVGPVTDFTHVVVDEQADPQAVAQIRDTGVDVIIAKLTAEDHRRGGEPRQQTTGPDLDSATAPQPPASVRVPSQA